MKHLFIINPAAGKSDRTGELSQKIREACEARSLSYEILVSRAPGDCTKIAQAAAATGEAVRITDKKQLARIEMLAFAADNRLVVSLTQMGYNAFLPDGKPTIGGADALGVFVRSRDSHGMSVYDNEHQLLRIDAQVSLPQAGIYIKGEDGESVRNFAPRQIRIAAGME